MKVITDGTEQLINLLANDMPLQLPTFRHEVMPSIKNNEKKNILTTPGTNFRYFSKNDIIFIGYQ